MNVVSSPLFVSADMAVAFCPASYCSFAFSAGHDQVSLGGFGARPTALFRLRFILRRLRHRIDSLVFRRIEARGGDPVPATRGRHV